MGKLKINKNWKYFRKDSRIHLFNLVTSKQLEIASDVDACFFILEGVNKNKNKEDLFSEFKTQFASLDKKWFNESLNTLKHWGILDKDRQKPKVLSNKYLNGLDRQLDYLEEFFPEEGKYEKQINLKNARIAVLGLGTIAQHIIFSLEACGVGNFVCVDFDKIEERNIGRQPMLRRGDIGKYKADVVAGYLKEGRNDISVKTKKIQIGNVHDVEKVVKDCDIVLHCCDYPRFLIHRWINEACLKLNKPNLLVYSGRVGPFSFPHESSCYGCMETFLKKHIKAYDEFTKKITNEGMGRYPELAVVGAITGSLAAKEVIAHILGIEIETKNNFFDINPANIKIVKHPLPQQKECYACGKKSKQ